MSELHNTPGGSPFDGEFGTGEFDSWADGLSESQLALQQDLSCLADGELDEFAAARAMVQLEEDADARAFLDDVRRFARLNRDLAEPDRVLARLAMLSGEALQEQAAEIDLTHRLATIFYQLGKAYVLAGVDPAGFRDRVFEAAVPIEATQTAGRGFVDGVLLRNRETESGQQSGRVDWRSARHLFNGRLERIAEPLDKGLRLLEQATEIDPSHEEARIYLAWVFARRGKKLKAADLYREVFETAIEDENRGHAAVQLGCLHTDEDEHRRAAVYYRWMSLSGLTSMDERFWFVDFNLAIAYLGMGNEERCLDYFRNLLDRHPDRAGDTAGLAVSAPLFRDAMDRRPGFAEALALRCPELLQQPQGGSQ